MVQGAGEGDDTVDLDVLGCEQVVEVGRGGFGVVHRAWQPAMARHVAVKILIRKASGREAERFEEECRAIGSLQGHPNIVTVHEAGRLAGGEGYIMMEYLGQGSLAQRLAKGPIAWAEAVEIGIKMAGVLESAHRARVLHRDVKPGNIMRTSYQDCKLGDFGIARVEGRGERPGAAVGSWGYAPPEVLSGREATPASDVYSLAATLFALVTGRPPFVRGPEEAADQYIRRVTVAPVPMLGGRAPQAVERVLRQALAADGAERTAGAEEFGRQLQAAQSASGMPVTPLPLAGDPVSFERAVGDEEPPTEYFDLVADDKTAGAGVAAPRDRSGLAIPERPWKMAGAAVLLAGLAVAAVVAFAVRGGGDGTPSSSTAQAGTTASSSTAAVAPTTLPGRQGVVLGRALPANATESCRTPTTGSGAAWQLVPVVLGSRRFESSFHCNLFAGGTGSLDFVLGGDYRTLMASIGFVDGSSPTAHTVRFEFIGDGRDFLTDVQTLRFSEMQDLVIDVTGITQLRIRITELSSPGGTGGPSQPVIAGPTLFR